MIAPAKRPVVQGLEEVSFCDSAGLNVLLGPVVRRSGLG
jgi:hypothetical protein